MTMLAWHRAHKAKLALEPSFRHGVQFDGSCAEDPELPEAPGDTGTPGGIGHGVGPVFRNGIDRQRRGREVGLSRDV
jgi:hypothetical protein